MKKKNLIFSFIVPLVLAGGVLAGWHEPIDIDGSAVIYQYSSDKYWLITLEDDSKISFLKLKGEEPELHDTIRIDAFALSLSNYSTVSVGDSLLLLFGSEIEIQPVWYHDSVWSISSPIPFYEIGAGLFCGLAHAIDDSGRVWVMTLECLYATYTANLRCFNNDMELIYTYPDTLFSFMNCIGLNVFKNGNTINIISAYASDFVSDTIYIRQININADSIGAINIRDYPPIITHIASYTSEFVFFDTLTYAYSCPYIVCEDWYVSKFLFNSPILSWQDSIVSPPFVGYINGQFYEPSTDSICFVGYYSNNYHDGDSIVYGSLSSGGINIIKAGIQGYLPYHPTKIDDAIWMVFYKGTSPAENAITYYHDSLPPLVDTSTIAERRTPEIIEISAHPNPFNSAVSITAPEGSEIEIFDLNGRMVYNNSVEDSYMRPAGDMYAAPTAREFIWTPDETVGSGVYLVRARVRNESKTKKIVFLK